MSSEKFEAAMDLLRRLDPTKVEKHLTQLIKLEPELAEDLLASVDVPLQVKKDPNASHREFLCCDYNRDIDSHRSPWTNVYVPSLEPEDAEESPFPSEKTRQLEILANDSFDIYRDLYYEGGVSSVYLWDLDDATDDFAGVILLKKSENSRSSWDAIHVLEVLNNGNKAEYRITTTIILHLNSGSQKTTLSGNLTRQTEKTYELPTGVPHGKLQVWHTSNLGSMIEDVESQMRNILEVVYFDKTRDIYHELRDGSFSATNSNRAAHEQVIKGLQGM
ncbi:LAMI_0G12750g1_1 [Lachancea mirantina]|uniref:F-actin-capping protein subunit beta n=1 Tax=Lachancea mirantina TaxID=1230905 RepID=A0A1G4KBH3_9SACH|nr:LAMI_0G12750g1_1 [Lachancea mirantina]